jgi:hypothetical protein
MHFLMQCYFWLSEWYNLYCVKSENKIRLLNGIGFQALRELFLPLLCMEAGNLSGTDYGELICLSLQWVSGCRLRFVPAESTFDT